MENLIARQEEILQEFTRIHKNFKKDPQDRKTPQYIKERVVNLDKLWKECEENDGKLMEQEDKSHQYYVQNIFKVMKGWYQGTRAEILQKLEEPLEKPAQENVGKPVGDTTNDSGKKRTTEFDTTQFESSHGEERLAELLQMQNANFRAFMRLVKATNIDVVTEKWEIEDKLKYLESRWITIDRLHLQIDGILNSENYDNYYEKFEIHESQFEALKRKLNMKLNTSLHQQHAVPKLEIPIFSGSYIQWPTFMDLYLEAIHNNPAISKTQKMQHLKGRLRGEAEKLVQHLHIAPENYNTCWELLNHRYNNKSLLFTKNFQVFMRQPNMQKQSAFELKRLYDTSNETIHAIHNLGVDTSSWDPVLVYILCEKLDSETYSEYMQSKVDPREIPTFDNFMDFIESKFIALEPLQRKRSENIQKPLPKTQFNNASYPYHKTARPTYLQPNKNSHSNNARNFNAYNVGQFNNFTCRLCKSYHAIFQCEKFANMADAEKLKFITKNNICKNCLYFHAKGYCASLKKCRECSEPHNTLLHSAFANSGQAHLATQPTSLNSPPSATNQCMSRRNIQNNIASNDDDEKMLATALVQVATINGDYVTLRAVVDPGSQVTLITENAVQRLGLQRQPLNASISGVGTVSNRSKGQVKLLCKSLRNDFQFTTEALIMNRVVNNLPNTTFAKKPWTHLASIMGALADPDYNISRPIDILLDVHVYTDIVMHGLIKIEGVQPMAQKTQIGWLLMGSVSNVKTYNCNVVINEIEDLAKYWEVEDIGADASTSRTTEENVCEEYYVATTKRLENGRYEVRLPMKPNFEQLLGKSRPCALAQFMQLERRLQKDAQLSESYKKFMQEYIQMQHMKENSTEAEVSCYLPHHGVLKQDSLTTKLRVVFNASQKTDTGYSLNDLMECGPKLHHDLMTLLLGWRLYRYVFTADCEKMYRMILVNKEDQQLQKILWRESKQDTLKTYALSTITYGMKASPWLALRTLKQLAQDDAHKYPLAAHVIDNEMYVDDVLSGSDSIENAQELQHQLIDMLQGAGLTLRKWTSNEPTLIENLSSSELNQTTMHFTNDGTTKALGLQWNPKSDSFAFMNKINTNCDGKLTKRMLLSEISKIFDPLGWLTPLTVKAKLLFQKIWLSGCNWDDILPKEIQDEWMQFTKDLHNIMQFDIPRWAGNTAKPFQIHGFCDASEKVYACAIYLHTLNEENEPVIRLIVAKSRLTPVKNKMTLPRLELCGAVLLARLMKKVLQAFKWDAVKNNTYAWTDSMIVLGWLNGDATKWKSFVSSRVQQVHDVIPKQHWRYVKSEDNAADCATRGTTCTQLLQHPLWWSGPNWLKNYIDNASNQTEIIPTTCESKQTHVTACVVQSEPSSIIMELIDRHSDMTHITKVVAWIMRFTKNTKTADRTQKADYLTCNELKDAEQMIIKQIQMHTFKDEISRLRKNATVSSKSNILSLNPFLDENDCLRVGGRLRNSTLSNDNKHPMILPHNHIATDLFILQAHHKTMHGGPKLILAHLRQRVWIVGGYRAVKRVLHKCTICRRFYAKSKNQIMADLPESRVAVSRPFSNTGVEFTGGTEMKTAKGELKRPILKLVPLVDAEEKNKSCTDKSDDQLPCKRNRTQKLTFKNFMCYTLLLIMTLITPAMQQTLKDINITPLTQHQTIYFDKIAEIQEIKDEWRLVFYYNLTNYWRNVDTIQQYVHHIKEFQNDDWAMQFHVLINQLEQSTNELSYYNELLKSPELIQHRYKRGLVDGIGYVANSLFGVLDQRFADKYESDIKSVQQNENHLLQLLKNQTSILEAEHNILQRNEATMTKHFNLINEHLNDLENQTLKERIDNQHAFYVITSAIAAEAILQNLKSIQETLINTLTNMHQGHIDVHLLSPNQLQTELNKIARHLPRDLALPEAQDDVTNIYKVLRIHARITQQYLLMEVKVPLLSDELYELDKLITIPQNINATQVVNVIPISELIAFNIKQYSFIPLEQNDISECQKVHNQKFMCKLNHPVYSTVSRSQSICDIQLIRNNEIHNAYCHTETRTCSDKWIKLHRQNTWFYFCCDICVVHIVCTAGMTTESLRHTGLITLRQGCVLRGDSFMLYANIEHATDVKINNANAMILPNISPINNIINTSINTTSLQIETHEEKFQNIQKELNEIKEQSSLNTLTTHDMHHYIMIYVVIFISIALFVASVWYVRKVLKRKELLRQGEERRTERDMNMRQRCKPHKQDDIEDGYSSVKDDKRHYSVVKKGVTSSSREIKFNTQNHSEVCD